MSVDIVYHQAFVALPSSLCGGEPVRGVLGQVEKRLGEVCASGKKAPLMIFLPGSNPRGQEQMMADWIVEELGFILIAPNTHAQIDRPSYVSPADPSIYDLVHKLRREEVSHVMDKIAEFDCIDRRFVVLAGLSEGAVAAATWHGDGITARMVLAWNCEPSYYIDKVDIAGDPDETPVLNLNGYHDEFFGPHAELGKPYGVAGHGSAALQAFKRAKVIIYPSAGHRVLDHPEARHDILQFLKYWRDYFLSKN
ncbi:MAG: hypothetical protein JKY27_09535 [Magnetovibrio sp.]|nr:hypothetical protein [Magnetovibrio sp.]